MMFLKNMASAKFNVIKFMLIMGLLFSFNSLIASQNDPYLDTKKFTFKFEDTDIKEVFNYIEDNSEYLFLYDGDVLGSKQIVSISAKNFSIQEIIDIILVDLDLDFIINERQIIIKQKAAESLTDSDVNKQSKNKTFYGIVKDEEGNALIGASVVIKNTNLGVTTNVDGRFSLASTLKECTLIISYIGYTQKEVKVKQGGPVTILLQDDISIIDKIVVVGYGSQKRVNLTGAVTSIDVEQAISSRPITDIAKALQGSTPGLSITTNVGGVGVGSTIKLRGSIGSLSAASGTSPLILVDNVEVPDLNLINPDDIQSISVLKDAASASIYGTRAAWGVILITTKMGNNNEEVRVSYSSNFAWNTPTDMPEVAKTYEGAEAMLSAAERGGNSSIASIGYNVDRKSIESMRDWSRKYGHMSQNQLGEMQLGRDFEKIGDKYYFYREFDPIDMATKKWSPQQKHNISISGGSEKTAFNISAGYLNQKGVMKVNTDEYSRYNLNANVTTQVRKWWKVRTSLMFSSATKSEPYQYTSGYSDIWYYLLRWPSFYPYADYQGVPFRSAVTEIDQAKRESLTTNFARANVGSEFTPMKNLSINLDYTFSLLNSYQKRNGGEVWGWNMFSPDPLSYSSFYGESHNRVVQISKYTMTNTFKAFATYNLDINKDNRLKLMVGMDAEVRENLGHSSERRSLINFDQPEIGLATGDQFVTNAALHNEFAALGFFARLNYDYKSKYLLEVNARYDGSSRFPEGDKWAIFPSFSAGWRVSEESFMDWSKVVLSEFKFRGSWGTIGNQDVNANSFLSVMNVESNSKWLINGSELPYIGAPSIISESLTWERITTMNLGFDARLLNNKLGVTFDWYKRTTSNMHSPGETLPSSFGSNKFPQVNEGEIQGVGFEVSVDYTHEFSNGLRLFTRGTISKIKETLTKYNNPSKNIYGNYEGKVIGEIWGYETDRLFQYSDSHNIGTDINPVWVIDPNKVPSQELYETGAFKFGPGDVKYKDLDGDGVISYGQNTVDDHGDLKRIGNILPNFEYGITIGLDYKGFDFSTFFQGVGSRDVWVVGQVGIPGYMPNEGWLDHQMDYWTPQNTDAFYPNPASHNWLNNNQNFLQQSRYLEDLSYIRCKNITIGYSLPQKVLDKISLVSARIYMSAENLFEFDNTNIPIDPETTNYKSTTNGSLSFGKSYPFMRTISFGIQVTF